MNSFRLLTLRNAVTVGFIAILAALVAFSFSLWQTPNYKSTVKLLAVFNQSDIDTYTASKTANYVTGILGEVVYSDSFINSVYLSDPTLKDNLGQGSEARQKAWKKSVKTEIMDNKGIMIIDVYGNDKYQVRQLAASIGRVIISQHAQYDGSENRVTIKMIDTPSIYESWYNIRIVGNAGLGFAVGLLIGFTLIVIFPDHKLFAFDKRGRRYPDLPIGSADAFQKTEGISTAKQEDRVSEIADIIASSEDKSEAGGASEATAARTSNPWLNQYYEENLADYQDKNS